MNGATCNPATGACACAAGWTGVICNDTCSSTRFGPNCIGICACQNGGTCDRFTGACACGVGWTGATCSSACASGRFGANCAGVCPCKNGASCDRFSGVCSCAAGWTGDNCDSACASGKYGANCTDTCTCLNGATCDRFNGTCYCTAGWTGVSCGSPCLSGRFGANCSNVCTCQNGGLCDRFTGACTCTAAGWTGASCAQPCASGRFGVNCTGNCTCRNGASCDRFTGTCACAAGWTGATCDMPCPVGQYGANCTQVCACLNGAACDHITGVCACTEGWTGVSCDQPCASDRFGANCTRVCVCANGAACNRFSGACTCTAGWSGALCTQACVSGRYGANCNGTCGCQNGAACDRFTGACQCTAPGWTGTYCDVACSSGRFGVNCGSTCACKNGAQCDRFNGSCACTAGWMGAACDVPCGRGLYGRNCALVCPCGDHVCDRYDGSCTCARGSGYFGPACQSCTCNGGVCDDGVSGTGTCNCTALLGLGGPRCNVPCDHLAGPSQMYGYGCASYCSCRNGAACNATSGLCTCVLGWSGVICDTIVAPSQPRVTATAVSSAYGLGIRLNWTHAEDSSGSPRAWTDWRYEIKRTGCFPKIYSVGDVREYVDTAVVIDQGYTYFVTAFNSRNVSSPEAGLAGIESLKKSEKPSPPIITSVTPTLTADQLSSAIKITWTEDTSSGPILRTYVFRDGVLLFGGLGTLYFEDLNVVYEHSYTYEIISENAFGNSTAATCNGTASIGPIKPGSATNVAQGQSSRGSSNVAGPVAGGVVASVVGAAGIVAAILFFRKRRSRRKMEALARSELELIDSVVRRPEIAEIEIPGSCVRLKNRIGEGEFGEVYAADVTMEREGLATTVRAAVKTFRVTALSTADEIRSARSAFMAEIDLMRSIPPHAHIIALLGVCTQSEPNCMVLEFAAHGDLRHFLIDSKAYDVTPTDLLCFCIDVARGMEHLAKCEIVHRDLAARNCMVVAGPRPANPQENGWTLSPKAQVIVKVADMGLSRETGASGDYYVAKTSRKLPIKWMAPESLEKRIFTHATDVWAFGIVMWEVFARGAKPYPGLENHAVAGYLAHNKRMDPPSDCPKPLHATMQACWRKHPETRPHFSQLILQLRRAMATLSGSAPVDHASVLQDGRGGDSYELMVPIDEYALSDEVVNDSEG
eukprot:Opistho-1_new@64454